MIDMRLFIKLTIMSAGVMLGTLLGLRQRQKHRKYIVMRDSKNRE